jgi:hypothetical protein
MSRNCLIADVGRIHVAATAEGAVSILRRYSEPCAGALKEDLVYDILAPAAG